MKTFPQLMLLSFFILINGCGKDNDLSSGCDLASCDPQKNTVRAVTDQSGSIGYSQEEEKWLIIVAIPNTYDSQDIGIVCTGLPEKFQEIGRKVTFSGEYKEKCDKTKGVLPGQTYFYLHVTEIDNGEEN